MAASKNSKPTESQDSVAKITPLDAEDIAQAIAAQVPDREELAHGTMRETNTVYEDRTANPEVDRDVEYEADVSELSGGSVLTTYGAPVGGFPEAE